MKVYDLIYKLHELAEQMGDVDVKVYSNDYCMDCHKIEDVTEGYTSNSGWTTYNDVIGICVTK